MLLAALAIRRTKPWLTLLAGGMIVCYITPVTTVFSLFTNPDYVRWGYALAIVIILMSLRYIDSGQLQCLTPRAVALYGVVCFAIFGAVVAIGGMQPIADKESVPLLVAAYSVLLLLNLAALAVYALTKRSSVLVAGIAVCATVQMMMFYGFRSDAYYKYVGRDDLRVPWRYILDNDLPRGEGDMRYRTAFFSQDYDNMPAQTGRPAVQTFHSVQNNNVLEFFCVPGNRYGLRHPHFRPTHHLRSFYALMSARDVVAYHGDTIFAKRGRDMHLTPVAHTAGYDTYINRDYLPMGIVYDYYVPQSYVDSLLHCEPMPDVPLVLLAALAVPDSAIAQYSQYLKPLSTAQPLDADSVIAARKGERRVSTFRGTTTGFTDTAMMSRTNYRLYTVPADRGFTAYVDGQETPIQKVSLGLAAVLVPQGQHAIEFRFFPAGLRTGLIISLIALLIIAVIAAAEHKKK